MGLEIVLQPFLENLIGSLIILEAESLRSGCQHGWVKALFHVFQISYMLTQWKGLGSSAGSLL